jgi:hypothetical protein
MSDLPVSCGRAERMKAQVVIMAFRKPFNRRRSLKSRKSLRRCWPAMAGRHNQIVGQHGKMAKSWPAVRYSGSNKSC